MDIKLKYTNIRKQEYKNKILVYSFFLRKCSLKEEQNLKNI